MNPTSPPINISAVKQAIQLYWSQGLFDQAREFEEHARLSGNYVGSCNTEEWLDKFITCDNDMLMMKDDTRTLAGIDDPVLITGETGTGKELIARALHGSRGPRKDDKSPLTLGRFVAINCPALSVDLMESTLFGHVKGAFTGALTEKSGSFQHAYKGTLFIDEIGDMPMSMQSAILRVLEEKVIVKVGDNEEVPVSCRIVCATNKNLESMVKDGTFRLDLLQRINTFELKTKALRERRGDIELLVKSMDKSRKFKLENDQQLFGNVRELKSMIRRWNVLGR